MKKDEFKERFVAAFKQVLEETCAMCKEREATEEIECLDYVPRLFCAVCAPKARDIIATVRKQRGEV